MASERLSRSGRDVFRELRRREGALPDAVFADIEIADIAVTRRTFEKILARIRSRDQVRTGN